MASKRRWAIVVVILIALMAFSTVALALSRVGITTPNRNFPVRVSATKKVILRTSPLLGPFIKVRYQVRTKYGFVWLFSRWRSKTFYFSGQGTGLMHVTRGVYVNCLPRSCRYGEMVVYK